MRSVMTDGANVACATVRDTSGAVSVWEQASSVAATATAEAITTTRTKGETVRVAMA